VFVVERSTKAQCSWRSVPSQILKRSSVPEGHQVSKAAAGTEVAAP
jgi:hypothetical protein